MLPPDAFILGVDEHTACTINLAAAQLQVDGLGVVTVRRQGHSTELHPGPAIPLAALRDEGEAEYSVQSVSDESGDEEEEIQSLPVRVKTLDDEFVNALAARDSVGAADAVLALDQ